MKRLRVFPFGEKLAAVSRRPLAVWMTGLLALAWLSAATAAQAEDRLLVPEPIVAPGGEPAPEAPRLLNPNQPRNPKQPAAVVPEKDDSQLLDPDEPRNGKRPAAVVPEKDASQLLDPDEPRNPERPAAASPQKDDAPLPDPESPKSPEPPAAAAPQPVDVAPSADEPRVDEDDDACEDGSGCSCRCWGPGAWWQSLPNRLEARGEWLLWACKGNYVPALVTTGPSTAAQAEAGLLGSSSTTILLGNSDLNDAARSGARIAVDYWLTCDHSVTVEGQYFGLGDNTANFQADNHGYPVLARPFFNAQTGAAQVHSIAYPGVQTGTVSVAATTDFQGAEALLRPTWYRGCDAHLDFLVGYRYLRLSDDLGIDEVDTFTNTQVPVGSTLALLDRFSTLNEFQGAELGFTSDWRCDRWNLGVLLKVGLGNTNSRVSISGSNTATEPGQTPVTSSGGFLAQAANSGQYEHNQFTMVPELGINLGFDLTPRLRLVGGYSLIYWSAVARTGDQIDLNLTFPAATGIRSPEFRFAMTDYWAQGLNLGLDLRF